MNDVKDTLHSPVKKHSISLAQLYVAAVIFVLLFVFSQYARYQFQSTVKKNLFPELSSL